MFRHAWILFMDVLENWSALVIVSLMLSWLYRRFTKRQQCQLKDIQMHIKRIELLQAINHYAHDKFEKYKKNKMEER